MVRSRYYYPLFVLSIVHFLITFSESEASTEDPVSSEQPTVNNEVRVETVLLRKKLRFFFLNPIEKWQTKRRLPYKFAIQVIKIFLVTYQVFYI